MVLIAAQPFSPAAQLGVFRGDTGGKRRRRSFFPVPARNTIENLRGCDAVKRLLATLSPSEPVQQADAWIVVDVLRATTTMVAFFDAGGEALFPVGDVPDAFRLRGELGERCMLLGERECVKVPGFDAGNSPFEMTSAMIARHPIAVMTTTNGTRAVQRAAGTGAIVLAGCCRNAAAVASRLEGLETVGILSAGRLGRFALDDTLCVGLIADRIISRWKPDTADDGVLAALDLYRTCAGGMEAGLRRAEHALLLDRLGFSRDIAFAAEADVSRCAPELEERDGHACFALKAARRPD